jgi:Phospholipase_D-nuclease N-terminal
MLAADYPLLNIFWTISIFFLWVAWIFIVIWVFIDNFRRRDHGGGAKALWTFVIIFVPLFGVLIYLISRPNDVEVVV